MSSEPGASALPEWQAPAHWRCIDFISDLHLQARDPATAAALREHLQHTEADALFVLGDLFEVWIGDDLLSAPPTADAALEAERAFIAHVCAALHGYSQRGWLGVMRGNRDFLLGPQWAQATGAHLLDDPGVLVLDDQRFLLSHGDAWCLDDHAYMRFRERVRSTAWQQAFLARPLAQRWADALAMRAQSAARARGTGQSQTADTPPAMDADLDAATVRSWLRAQRASTLVHGHTHRPALHAVGDGLTRVVLSDWDAAAHPPRLEILRLQRGQGLRRCPAQRAPAGGANHP